MARILYIIALVAAIWAVTDVLKKMHGRVEKALWLIAVLCLPLFGPAFWYYVQYHAPRQKRLRREERARKLSSGKKRDQR